MKLTVRGYDPLVLPKEAFIPMRGSFGGATPYVAKIAARWKQKGYIQGKLPLKLLCLKSLYSRATSPELGGYMSYSDPMAGIGLSVRIFGHQKRLILNDLDPSCRQVLQANFRAKVTGDDILTAPMKKADLIFLDFNDYTMKRGLNQYKAVVQRAFAAANFFVVLNDCSLFYLRYGEAAFKTYSRMLDCEIHSVEDYFRAVAPLYREQGWHLIQASYFTETSFLLLSRKRAPLVLKRFQLEDVAEGMVTVEG